ncbi:MAG TPA: dTMP kinase, partial [Micromonosporaceae bacterium]
LWVPAKEAAVPNLLPRGRLETANQLTLVTTYGLTPVLAAVVLAAASRLPHLGGNVTSADLALYFNALTFLASALVVLFGIHEISGHRVRTLTSQTGQAVSKRWWRTRQWSTALLADLAEGWRYLRTTPVIRGLVVGMLGAFAGGGVVVGTAKFYALSLGGGDATFAILFAVLFVGLGLGITAGPRLIGQLSRRRWFALSIVLAGVAVAAMAFAPWLGLALFGAVVVGAGAGMAFLAGITLIGIEVTDQMRGRVFAFGQTAVRVTLLLTISVSSVLVGVGSTRELRWGAVTVHLSASRVLLLIAGVAAVAVGILALRQMDDRKGTPVLRDVWASIRRQPR